MYKVIKIEGLRWSHNGREILPEHKFDFGDTVDPAKVPPEFIEHYTKDGTTGYIELVPDFIENDVSGHEHLIGTYETKVVTPEKNEKAKSKKKKLLKRKK